MNMKTLRSMLILILAAVCQQVIMAQATPQTLPETAAADELFNAKKWPEAEAAYAAIVKRDPNDAQAWYQLAMTRYSLKKYAPAADAFQRNIAIGNSGFAMYNLACVYSLMGERDKAVEWLSKSVDNPKMVLAAINFSDPDLANLKDDARFKQLAEKTDRKLRPCMYDAEARQFDFWVGEWDAFNPQGRKVGTSVIQNISSGCGILENWTNALGGAGGKSINFYDATAGKWFQYWIGSSGGPVRYSGNYKDGAMRYAGETVGKDNKKTLLRLTFFNLDPNTVRQLAENSPDDGKTWTTTYDLKYVRRK